MSKLLSFCHVINIGIINSTVNISLLTKSSQCRDILDLQRMSFWTGNILNAQ